MNRYAFVVLAVFAVGCGAPLTLEELIPRYVDKASEYADTIGWETVAVACSGKGLCTVVLEDGSERNLECSRVGCSVRVPRCP